MTDEQRGPRRTAALPTYSGWMAVAVGAVLLIVGWYDVSGQADVARQLPYFASTCLPGAALVVGGAVLIAADAVRRRSERVDQQIAELHALLVERGTDQTLPDAGGAFAVPDGTRFHRPGCPLLAGKDARPVGPADVSARALTACPLCDPAPVE